MNTSIVVLINDAVLLGIALFYRNFLGSYMDQKGKNLATKEDTREITQGVEEVRSQFQTELESMKHEFSRIGDVHRIQFQWEFPFLQDLWGKITDILKEANWLAFASAERPGSTRGNAEEKLSKFVLALDSCTEVVSRHKPFFHPEVYDQIDSLLTMLGAWYIGAVQASTVCSAEEYWRKVEENQEEIVSRVELVCEKIRERAFPKRSQL
jgi:hypothetical protein